MIRLLRDYTGAELEALSEEQTQRLVDLECAEAGVPFLPDPPAPYTPLKNEHDVRLYQVGSTNVLVFHREHAEEIAAFLKKYELWVNTVDWKFGYNFVARPSEDKLEIAAIDSYSAAKLHERKDAIARDEEAKKAYETASHEYQKALTARDNVSASVWKVLHEAWWFRSRREAFVAQLARYVELADGDAAIGLRFFEKANPDYREYFSVEIVDGKTAITAKHFANPENEYAAA